MSNVGSSIWADVQYGQLHPVVDQQKCFTVFPIRFTGGTSQLNYPHESTVNATTPSVSSQINFALYLVFQFSSEANLSILATSRHLTVNSSNKSGFINQLSKSMILLNLSAVFFLNQRNINFCTIYLNVMLRISSAVVVLFHYSLIFL